jgi:hypothetical protein
LRSCSCNGSFNAPRLHLSQSRSDQAALLLHKVVRQLLTRNRVHVALLRLHPPQRIHLYAQLLDSLFVSNDGLCQHNWCGIAARVVRREAAGRVRGGGARHRVCARQRHGDLFVQRVGSRFGFGPPLRWGNLNIVSAAHDLVHFDAGSCRDVLLYYPQLGPALLERLLEPPLLLHFLHLLNSIALLQTSRGLHANLQRAL